MPKPLTAISNLAITSYTYDTMNRIATATGMSYTWDDNGNLAAWDDGQDDWAYRYDSMNRLIKVEENGAASARYTYDADDRRVRSWDAAGTTDYVYSGLNVIDEVRGGAHEKHYYVGSMHLASNSSGTVEYYHADHLGSTRLKTDVSGNAIYESNYEPYGPEYGESGSEEFRYTGKQEDPTGLYYFGARYYDPVTGRFTTRDSTFGDLSDPQSLNGYVYCRNNPHKYTDPDGRIGVIAGLALIGGIAGGWWYITHTSEDEFSYKGLAISVLGGAIGGAMTGAVFAAAGATTLASMATIKLGVEVKIATSLVASSTGALITETINYATDEKVIAPTEYVQKMVGTAAAHTAINVNPLSGTFKGLSLIAAADQCPELATGIVLVIRSLVVNQLTASASSAYSKLEKELERYGEQNQYTTTSNNKIWSTNYD